MVVQVGNLLATKIFVETAVIEGLSAAGTQQ